MSNYKFDEPKIENKFQEIEKESEVENAFQPIPLGELMKKEFPETKWIVEELIPVEGIVAVSGVPSAYKTWLILELAIKVASGTILFDKFDTKKCGVLFIDEETGERWVQQRILKLSNDFDLPIYLASKTGFKLNEKTIAPLLAFIHEHEIGIVIFDSLLRVHTASDENNAVEMEKVFSLFRKITKTGTSVIFTHHHRKQMGWAKSNPSQDMRGSSDILAAVDCHLAIERKEESVVITQTKSRQSEELKPFKLDVIQEDNEFHFEFAGEVEEEKTKKADFREAIKNLLEQEDNPLYKQKIFDRLKVSGLEGAYGTFKAAIKDMVDKGELFEKRGERNKMFCSLKPFEANQMLLDGDDTG